MFEVDGRYANRSGPYTVLSINPPKMTVRYDDGKIADLRINIQERIWENLQAELAKSSANSGGQGGGSATGTRFYIKSIQAIADDDLDQNNIKDFLAVFDEEGSKANAGDRFIYLALDQGIIFAVATITGDSVKLKGAAYNDRTGVNIYPVDIDAFITRVETGIAIDSIELESQPDFLRRLGAPDTVLEITEDEFENVAEILGEVDDDDDEDAVEIDDEEDDVPEIEV